jgi:hypothetical protein
VWCKDFAEGTLLERLGQFLATAPGGGPTGSAAGSLDGAASFTELVIRAVSPAEMPVAEWDLRGAPADAATIVALASEYLHADSSYEVRTKWDLWTYDAETKTWQLKPQPLEILCHGEDYDDAVWQDSGHFEVDAGFEHFFTGHGGLLGFGNAALSVPQSALEAEFLAAMAQPKNLTAYHEKTRENIRTLYNWMQRAAQSLPLERWRLWSEGEENFEARLEDILSVR